MTEVDVHAACSTHCVVSALCVLLQSVKVSIVL